MNDAIQLPHAPGIPGLRFRHFRAGRDFEHMSAILRASAEVDDTERSETPEDLENYFAHLTNCDPYTDMIFAEVDPGHGGEPQVIGYARGAWRMEASGERRYMFFVRILPQWRRKGIDQAMLDWMERRLREIAGGHPTEVEKFFLSLAEQGERDLAALLEQNGYQPARYGFEMVRPDLENIPDPPLPEGLEVRPVLPEHYRAIWEADSEAFRDHWGSSSQAKRITRHGWWTRAPFSRSCGRLPGISRRTRWPVRCGRISITSRTSSIIASVAGPSSSVCGDPSAGAGWRGR